MSSAAFHLAELAVPTERDLTDHCTRDGRVAPSWAVLGYQQIAAEHHRTLLGHTDLIENPDTAVIRYADQQYTGKRVLLALRGAAGAAGTAGDGYLPTVPATVGVTNGSVTNGSVTDGDPDDVLGFMWAGIPLRDNTSLLEFYGDVRPEAEALGVRGALWDAVRSRAAQHDRSSIITYTSHPIAEADTEVLVPPTGFGRIEPDAAATFLLENGLRLEQAERQSLLSLPLPPGALDEWQRTAQATAGPDYRLTLWTGETPDELLVDMAGLMRRMSVDVPTADVDYDEEDWDSGRVRHQDAQVTRTGHRHVRAIVHHVPTGAAAGFTVFEIPVHRTGFAYQNDTLVHGDHRGRSLGLLLKAANLRQLLQVRPDVERIHTWNAGENGHMLAINSSMGFRPVAWEGLWQLRI